MSEASIVEIWAKIGWVEAAAVVCNVCYVILAVRRNIWCWPFGIMASVLSVFLFLAGALYAETALFVFYIAMGFYGWWQWGLSRSAGVIMVQTKNWSWHFTILCFGWMSTVITGWMLQRYTDAFMPYLDACTTVFAIIATWLTARKILANWLYWIAVNSLGIYLYQSRGFFLYAVLALFFTAMSIYGFYAWRKALSNNQIL